MKLFPRLWSAPSLSFAPLGAALLGIVACHAPAGGPDPAAPAAAEAASGPLFTEAQDVLPMEDIPRRKWDSPVVADLDQDGRVDLVLTEHGKAASVYWNQGGRFTEPQLIVWGDTHGVAVGDLDHDGLLEMVISQGGGDGKKPRNPVLFKANRDRTLEGGDQYEHFERSRGRATKLIDADQDGDLDLVLTAFPLKTQKRGANIFYENTGGGTFEQRDYLPRAQWMGFRALHTDFNGDGEQDLVFYGGKDMRAVRAEAGVGYSDATEAVFGDLKHTTLASVVAEIDYDNDGDFDLFVGRSDHPFETEACSDHAAGRFAFFLRREPVVFEGLKVEGDLEVENLQMGYPHQTVYVGAQKRVLEIEGDKHGGKNFTLTPEDAQGWPEDRDEPGLYLGHVGGGAWKIGGHTNGMTSAVIHHAVTTPETIAKDPLPAKLLENRGGTFVDVTEAMGLSIHETTTGAVVGDFDNDGWTDLFVKRYGNQAQPNEQILYLNRGGRSFERVDDHGIVARELGASGLAGEVIDYDADGDLDLLFCNERGFWHLYTNHAASNPANHWLRVRVGSSPSGGATLQGAVLTLKAGGHTYRRTVGATPASFSHGLDPYLHVGLGGVDAVDSATVVWTNGETQELTVGGVNQTVEAGTFAE